MVTGSQHKSQSFKDLYRIGLYCIVVYAQYIIYCKIATKKSIYSKIIYIFKPAVVIFWHYWEQCSLYLVLLFLSKDHGEGKKF